MSEDAIMFPEKPRCPHGQIVRKAGARSSKCTDCQREYHRIYGKSYYHRVRKPKRQAKQLPSSE